MILYLDGGLMVEEKNRCLRILMKITKQKKVSLSKIGRG